MTRRDLVARMGEDELREQVAFAEIDPLPDGYWQAARIALAVAQAMGDKNAKLEHFLPRRAGEKTGLGKAAGLLAIHRIRALAARADAEKERANINGVD